MVFKNLSIQSKLFAIIWSTLLLAILFSSVAFIIYDRQSSKLRLGADTQALAKIVAARSAAALAFRDKRVAKENLAALDVNLALDQACLYQQNHALFAQFTVSAQQHCPERLTLPTGDIIYGDEQLQVPQAIHFKGHEFGALMLQVSYRQINQRQAQFTKAAILILAGCSLLGYFLTASLQRMITKPIAELADLSRQVRYLGDYSLRAKQHSNDETGMLVSSFNNMLNQIQQTHWQMEDLVAEMKLQSNKSQLQATDAQSQTQAVRQFFAGASHDLKQPLNAIGLFSEILQNQPLPLESQEVIIKLQQANDNLNALFAELLDNEKIESRLDSVQLEPCLVNGLITKLLLEFEPLAMDKGIELRSRLSGDINVISDLHLLERILRNLLSNAIRYTHEGGILVSVRLRRQFALLQIWDTGQGIPFEQQDSIFEQYVQLNNPNHETSKGFGLGLSIVKRLSSSLQHPIALQSVPGKGTCFSLSLPRTGISADSKPELKDLTRVKNESVKWNENVNINPFEGKKVLIIDDEVSSLEALEMQLSQWQLDVEMAQNSADALEAVQEYDVKPDLIICDYHLGKSETGISLLEQLLPILSVCPQVLMSSAHADEQLQAEFKAKGYFFISKPLQAAKLKAVIGNLLQA